MPRPRLAPAVAALALATACAEDPSFVLRWQVGRSAAEADGAELLSVRQCSELGISRVRVTTLDGNGNEVDQREFPCFPEQFRELDGAAPGPEVGPGEYYVTIVGLDRRGATHADPAAPDDPDRVLARDNRTISVAESGEGRRVDSFRLVGASECDDAIDNDRDGGVDDGDLACRQGAAREDQDRAASIFTFEATLLGSNPAANCAGLGVASLAVILDDDPALTQKITCTTVPQSFSAYLPPGEHTWAVQGLNGKGEPVTRRIPEVATAFTVGAEGNAYVPIAIDLAIDVFTAPFSESLRFSVEYLSYEDSPLPRPCDASGLDLGTLVLGKTRVTLLDETGALTKEMVTLVDALEGEDADFPVDAVCEAFDRPRVTSELLWSPAAGQRDYSLKIETWAAADDPLVDLPCFSNEDEPARLAPGISPTIVVPRLRSDGNCADCSCVDDKCPTSKDCSRCDEDGVCKL